MGSGGQERDPSGTRRIKVGRAAMTAFFGILLVALLATVLATLPRSDRSVAAEDRLPVAVSILPQAAFVERIGGDRVAVTVAVAPGESPASFDATPRHLARLAEARVYFATGVPMENQLLPRLRSGFTDLLVVDTAAGLELRSLEAAHDHTEINDGEADARTGEPETSHGLDPRPDLVPRPGLDPHVWLDPRLVATQARRIADALAALDPPHAGAYAARCQVFVAELEELHHELAAILAPVAGRDLFVFHPAFGYLADAYGLHQVAIEQGGLAPSPRHLATVLTELKEQGATTVFVQPQYSLGSARAVAEAAGVEMVVLDPLARDYLTNLRRMAVMIREALDDR